MVDRQLEVNIAKMTNAVSKAFTTRLAVVRLDNTNSLDIFDDTNSLDIFESEKKHTF